MNKFDDIKPFDGHANTTSIKAFSNYEYSDDTHFLVIPAIYFMVAVHPDASREHTVLALFNKEQEFIRQFTNPNELQIVVNGQFYESFEQPNSVMYHASIHAFKPIPTNSVWMANSQVRVGLYKMLPK